MSAKTAGLLALVISVISGLFLSVFISWMSTEGQVLSETEIGENEHETYLVSRVVDGDTVHLLRGEETIKFRLVGIDTPETVDPRKEVECYGQEAKEYLEDLILNQQVVVENDLTQDAYDRYGRMLGYIYLGDVLVNLKMIEEGYAYEYTYRLPYQFQDEFKNAQARAQLENRGLWSESSCDGQR